MKPLSSFFLLCIVATAAHSQQTHTLTLEQSIAYALKNGYAVQNTASQYQTSKRNFEAALRKLRTSVNLSLDVPSFSESLSSQFNPTTQLYEFYQLSTTRIQTGLVITQPLVFTGGTLTIREILFGRDQTSGLAGLTRSGRDYFNNFLIEYRQPILTPNLHAINADRAELGIEQVETDFVKNQLDVIYNITEGFYSLYQLLQRVDISKEQVKQNEESFRTAKNKYEAGLIPEVEVLQSEVDLVTSQNDLLNTERELARSKNAFRLQLGIPTADDIILTASLSFTPVSINTNKAIDHALQHRSEVLNADRDKELRRIDIDVAESRNDFRLDMTATYGFNRNDTQLSNTFQDLGRTRSATLTFSIPLFDWGSTSLEIEAATIQHKNALAAYDYVQQQVRQEIIDLINRIRVAESRIQVLEKSVAVAQKSYDISLSRFQSGTINRNDLAQAQQRLTAAKLNNLNALIDYHTSLADLKRKTLYDFEKNEAVQPEFIE